jgi:hypothetical protein
MSQKGKKRQAFDQRVTNLAGFLSLAKLLFNCDVGPKFSRLTVIKIQAPPISRPGSSFCHILEICIGKCVKLSSDLEQFWNSTITQDLGHKLLSR